MLTKETTDRLRFKYPNAACEAVREFFSRAVCMQNRLSREQIAELHDIKKELIYMWMMGANHGNR